MPFRPWCVAVALGLITAGISSASYGQSYGQDAHGSEYPQNYSAIADLPFHPALDAEATDPGCDQGHDDRKSDLCAQWKAADAAANSADAAWVQLWVGSLIGIFTLLAASAAAIYARAAANHTASSVAVAEDLGRRGLRAYMDVHAAQWGLNDETPPASLTDIQARVAIRNAGQTPARNVFIASREKTLSVARATEEVILDAIETAEAVDGAFSVESGGVIGYKINNLVTPDQAQALEHGELHSYFIGRITYTDVFGIDRESTWCLRVENFGTDRIRVFPYKYGNRTT